MKIGIIGAGYVGRSLAGASVKAGHEVMISNSRGPHTLFTECGIIGCTAGTIEEAATFGEIVVVAITMKHYKATPVQALDGKVVIDTNNYYPSRDDAFAELDNRSTTSSELLALHLPGSKIVKAFNAIRMPHFDRDGQPSGSFDRRALPMAGDDAASKDVVAGLHDTFGYDVVDVGPLSEGWRFEPGMPVYCIRLNRNWLTRALGEAVRQPTEGQSDGQS